MGIFTIALDCFADKSARNDVRASSLRGAKIATKQSRKNNAFTLAEIMIVLTVIGVLTAILLPAARQITPDENVIKFKKAHNTLYTVIRELVTSDKYYLDGDLGVKVDGTRLFQDSADNEKYLCNTFADVLVTKKVSCVADRFGAVGNVDLREEYQGRDASILKVDSACAEAAYEEIVTADDIVFYQTASRSPFGAYWATDRTERLYEGPSAVSIHNDQGFDPIYKIFCIDIDGINKGEAPFGYGIRADGKILNGARATEWLSKSIQGDD